MVTNANGESGRAWVEAVPSLVAELAERWQLTLGPPIEGGHVAYVAPGERPGGERVVLKVSFPDDENRSEADALALWDGDGAVRLLDADRGSNAMLLERLEPGTPLEDHADRDGAIGIACGLLRRLHRPVQSEHPFPLATDLARRWAREIPEDFERLGRPFDPGLVQEAVTTATELAAWDGRTMLVNRDFHLGNVLAARREPWLAIDPKPVAGEPAFDSGYLLQSVLPHRPGRSVVRRTARRLAAELDVDPERIRAWALVRCTDNAVWGLFPEEPWSRRQLHLARMLASGS
jgi:streptomycin 6-kinase